MLWPVPSELAYIIGKYVAVRESASDATFPQPAETPSGLKWSTEVLIATEGRTSRGTDLQTCGLSAQRLGETIAEFKAARLSTRSSAKGEERRYKKKEEKVFS